MRQAHEELLSAVLAERDRITSRRSFLSGGAKLADGKNFFHADHGNLAGSGAAISVTTASAGRAAIRVQKGVGDEVLGYAPRILLVGPAQETAADQFVAAHPERWQLPMAVVLVSALDSVCEGRRGTRRRSRN